jgi:HK97 gp10 family phage protein
MSVKSKNNFEKVHKNVDRANYMAMTKAVLFCEGQAKKNCPVLTGRLMSSIFHRVTFPVANTLKGEIGSNVFYAPYVEFGTSKQSAHPYLRPAIDENVGRIQQIFADEIKKVI